MPKYYLSKERDVHTLIHVYFYVFFSAYFQYSSKGFIKACAISVISYN